MMPSNKHKRKASAHSKPKAVKRVRSSGLITSHPKVFALVGICLVVFGIYLLAFESQNNAMFGFAMLSLIAGVATTIYANFAVPKNKTN
jgi:inner membrane protein involved in colicin E2 resistance